MNEEEVKKQLKQMVNFILKEANEKASEIHTKAEEEFNIEKQRIVQVEKQKIKKDFERKEKQVEVKKKIAASNELNNSRLKILKAREDEVVKIYKETFERLGHISKSSSYKELLRKLIVQGLIKLDEPTCSVICRAEDRALVQDVLSSAVHEASEKLKKKIDVSLDPNNAPPCAGGVWISAKEGRILCNNTLEQRLRLAYEQQLPLIRTTLFGKSTSRKFMS